MKETTYKTIRNYVENGIPMGGFLTAVFSNDLLTAVAVADEENYAALKEIVIYAYNECPSECNGSKDKIDAWIEKGGLKGR